MPFDRDSGLVFNERIIAMQQQCRHEKKHKHNKTFVAPIRSASDGPRSLVDMAKNTLFRNMDKLDHTALQHLPPSMIDQLWTSITDSAADSLHAWQVFARTGIFDNKKMKKKKKSARRMNMSCMKPECLMDIASSPEMSWLTNLTVGSVAMDMGAALSISQIPNIRNIHIQACQPGIDRERSPFTDRLLRSWAADATDRGAMSLLEMIFMDDQLEITTNALRYLGAFPKLNMFTVRDCGINAHSNATGRAKIVSAGQRVGWNLNRPGALEQFVTQARWGSWSQVVEFYTMKCRAEGDDHRPVIHVEAEVESRLHGPLCTSCDRVLSFERNWNYEPIALAHEMEPATKRRKIRASSSRAAQELMSGVI